MRHWLAGLALAMLAGVAGAQEFPTKLIRVLCAFGPGQAADIVARVLAEQLGPRLGQQVIVDNRPGASGTIASTALMKSPPDGHTLLVTSTSIAINTAILENLPYDLERDFAPVALINPIPAVLIVNPAFPANTFEEFVALVRKNPGKYSFGHPGSGTMQNFTMQFLMQDQNLRMIEVPYKGSPQAVAEIIGGTLDMMFESANAAATHIRSGKVKGLAASGPVRYFGTPDIPTARERGVPLSVVGFTVMLAPARTPPAVVNRLNREIREIVQIPQVRERMLGLGFDVYPPMSPDEVGRWLKEQSDGYIRTATAAKLPKQ